ncbi:DUF2269 family protein [Paenibacillus sp. GP183]|uniref:DUF2269 family protein n=1 Tax=Paenibacillus sp. GP183 TaxID=1882751 RepID=UPI000896C771|nr:DUF2269 family protein [Paenibacillus sp. GP183]SEB82989.1 Predicted integral membrane protein [Paenibacillus sp. GP183]
MSIFLGILVVLHVLAAIVGIGPAFILPVLGKSAKTGSQLRFVFGLIKKVNNFPKIGGITLLITGILLMIVSKTGFSLMWLNLSLLLFVIIEVIIIGFVEPQMKKVTQLVMSNEGDQIPSGFADSMKRITPLEGTVHVLTFLIIILMVLKPF